jgi:nitrogen fixation protein NifU and related proteins
MMSELRELYQEVILDHSKSPRNFRFPEGANCSAEGDNPLCGDNLTVKLILEGDTVIDIGFQGSGCAISQAAASTMTEMVKGKSTAEINEIFTNYHDVVMGKAEIDEELLGKLAVFAGVAEFPMRVKCATLSWHTMQQAIKGRPEAVTTE